MSLTGHCLDATDFFPVQEWRCLVLRLLPLPCVIVVLVCFVKCLWLHHNFPSQTVLVYLRGSKELFVLVFAAISVRAHGEIGNP